MSASRKSPISARSAARREGSSPGNLAAALDAVATAKKFAEPPTYVAAMRPAAQAAAGCASSDGQHKRNAASAPRSVPNAPIAKAVITGCSGEEDCCWPSPDCELPPADRRPSDTASGNARLAHASYSGCAIGRRPAFERPSATQNESIGGDKL